MYMAAFENNDDRAFHTVNTTMFIILTFVPWPVGVMETGESISKCTYRLNIFSKSS